MEEKIDVLLFVSAWGGINETWRGITNTKSKLFESATAIINYCKQENIPTIFYSKEDPPNYFVFLEHAKMCDYIFTSCEECIPYYKKDADTERVSSMLFGINPVLHNPIGICMNKEKRDKIIFAGSWMKKYPKRCEDMTTIFNGILNSHMDLVIIDRNYANSNYAFPQRYKKMVFPSVDHKLLQKVHKLFDWAVNINSVISSNTMFANRTFELSASGVLQFSNYSAGVNSILPHIFLIHDSGEIVSILDSFSNEELYSHKIAGIRAVMTGHTCFDRVMGFLSPLGLKCEQPIRSVLVITEEDTSNVRECFQRQTYPHKHLILQNQVTEKVLEDYDMVTWFDPDSNYDPYYLEDMINGFKYTACDYITKDAWYEGETLHEGQEHMYVSHMSSPFRSVFWRECFEDSFFMTPPQEQDLENGYSIDHFSYCKNPILLLPKKEEYKVSVIVPVFNNGPHLYGKFFTSVRRSSIFEDMEILLIDDGSTDENTLRMEEHLRKSYTNIRLFQFGDGGSGSASRPRNKGVELASAEYIIYFDPDDEAICDGYAILYNYAKNEDLDIAFGNAYRADTRLLIFNWYKKLLSKTGNVVFENGLKDILPALDFFSVRIQSMVIRKALLLENNLTQVVGAIGEDTLFSWQLLSSAHRIRAVDIPIHIYYAQTAGSVTNQLSPSFFEKTLLVQPDKVNWLVKSGLIEEYMEKRHAVYTHAWIFKKLSQAQDGETSCKLVEKILAHYDNYYNNSSPEINNFMELCKHGQYDEAMKYIEGLFVNDQQKTHPSKMIEVIKPKLVKPKETPIFNIAYSMTDSIIELNNLSRFNKDDQYSWLILADSNLYQQIYSTRISDDSVFKFDYYGLKPGNYKVRALVFKHGRDKTFQDCLYLTVTPLPKKEIVINMEQSLVVPAKSIDKEEPIMNIQYSFKDMSIELINLGNTSNEVQFAWSFLREADYHIKCNSEKKTTHEKSDIMVSDQTNQKEDNP